jgi:cell shape-determining protein MreD
MPMNLLESLPTVIGTAAVAPALLLLWLVIAADERPGPPAKVWTAFLLGAASSRKPLGCAGRALGIRGRPP